MAATRNNISKIKVETSLLVFNYTMMKKLNAHIWENKNRKKSLKCLFKHK